MEYFLNKRLYTAVFVVLFKGSAFASDCLGWFLESGLGAKRSNCEIKCSITPVDMGSFSCPEKCPELCSKNTVEHILQYVPRLTEGDRVVISKKPYEAYKVFLAKEKVNKITKAIFEKPSRKDESDAFRHFVWSSLLSLEIGDQEAKVFLDAHEEDSTQSTQEKKMDIYNNDQGLSYVSEELKKGTSPNLADIEKEALQRLREKKLMVLEPRLEKIPGGYYSK